MTESVINTKPCQVAVEWWTAGTDVDATERTVTLAINGSYEGEVDGKKRYRSSSSIINVPGFSMVITSKGYSSRLSSVPMSTRLISKAELSVMNFDW